jgi:hypothetical protein
MEKTKALSKLRKGEHTLALVRAGTQQRPLKVGDKERLLKARLPKYRRQSF